MTDTGVTPWADNKIYEDKEILNLFSTACLTQGSAHSEGEAGWFLDENDICDDSTFLRVIKQFAMPADQDLPKPLQKYSIEDVVAFTEEFRAMLMDAFDTATENVLQTIHHTVARSTSHTSRTTSDRGSTKTIRFRKPLVWLLVNPVAFPAPETTDAWTTRGVLAGHEWLRQGNGTVGASWPNVRNLCTLPVTLYVGWATLRRRPVHAAVASALLGLNSGGYTGSSVLTGIGDDDALDHYFRSRREARRKRIRRHRSRPSKSFRGLEAEV